MYCYCVQYSNYYHFDFFSVYQSCFLCELGQPIVVSNVVCQQHALEVREMWLQRRPSVTSREEVVMTTEGNRVGVVANSRSEEDRNVNRVEAMVTPIGRYQVGGVTHVGQGAGQYRHDDNASPKMLCRTPGCAFYSIPELNGYCRDCFSTDRKQQY